jgi:hypothetical protein
MTKRKTLEIVLPPMTGKQAYLVGLFFDNALRLIWDTYGDDMADYEGRVFPDDPPSIEDFMETDPDIDTVPF